MLAVAFHGDQILGVTFLLEISLRILNTRILLYIFFVEWKKNWTRIQQLSAHPYYSVLVAILAGLDLFLWFVPNDLLFISAVTANSKQWLRTTIIVTIGSFIGGAALFFVAGLWPNWIHLHFPELAESTVWQDTKTIFLQYGYLAMFFGSVGPIPMQPFLVVAAFANASPVPILFGLGLGRLLKFLALGYLTQQSKRHIPKLTKISARKRKPDPLHLAVRAESQPVATPKPNSTPKP